MRHADVAVPASPTPYKGFTTDRAEFIDQFHDPTNKLVLPGVEYVARHAKANFPLMMH